VVPVIVFQTLVVLMGVGLIGIWWGIFGITWSAALFAYFYAGQVLKKSFPQ